MTSIFRRKARRGWTLKYRDGKGRARMRSFRTRELAENEVIRQRANPDTGDRRNLRGHAAEWLASGKLHLRPSSSRVYLWAMRKHVLPALGDLPLREITRAHVRDVVRRGLEEARGNYKIVARLFNMEPRDYKRFLNFLRKHDCQIPFKDYR